MYGIFMTKAKAMAPLIMPPQAINISSLNEMVRFLKKMVKK
jgi:hypothetical protein